MSNSTPNANPEQYQEEWLSAYLDQELTPEQVAIVEARLQMDSNAQQALIDLQRIRRILTGLPAWPESETSLAAELDLSSLQLEAAPQVEPEVSGDVKELDHGDEPVDESLVEPVDAKQELDSEDESIDLDDQPSLSDATPSLVISESQSVDVPEDFEQSAEDASELVDNLEDDFKDFEEDFEEGSAEELATESTDQNLSRARARTATYDDESRGMGWLRPVGIAASVLAMAGIGWALWSNNFGMSLASNSAETSSKTDPASRSSAMILEEEADDEILFMKEPAPRVDNSAGIEPLTDGPLPSELPMGQAASDALPARSSDLELAFGAPSLPQPSAPATPAPAEADFGLADSLDGTQGLGSRGADLDMSEAFQLGGNVPGRAESRSLPALPRSRMGDTTTLEQGLAEMGQESVEGENLGLVPSLSSALPEAEEDDPRPSMRLMGAAYSEPWTKQEVQTVVDSLGVARANEMVISSLPQERIIASDRFFFESTTDEQQFGLLADRFRLEQTQLRLPSQPALESESEVSVEPPKTILLFVTREKAEEILAAFQSEDAASVRSQAQVTELKQTEDQEAVPFLLAPMVLRGFGGGVQQASPTDRVILQLNSPSN